MLRRKPGFRQRHDVNRGVPNRRPTGLNAKIIGIIDKQSPKIFFRLGVNRICSGITEHAQSNHAVQHRWIHGREAIAALTDPLKHPPLRFFERTAAQRTKLKWMQEFHNIFDSQKEIAPSPEAFAAGETQVSLLGAERIELVQLLFARQNASRFEMVDD